MYVVNVIVQQSIDCVTVKIPWMWAAWAKLYFATVNTRHVQCRRVNPPLKCINHNEIFQFPHKAWRPKQNRKQNKTKQKTTKIVHYAICNDMQRIMFRTLRNVGVNCVIVMICFSWKWALSAGTKTIVLYSVVLEPISRYITLSREYSWYHLCRC